MKRSALLFAALVSLVAVPAAAAPAPGLALRFPAAWRAWTLTAPDGSETKVSEVHVPLVSTVRLAPSLDVVVSSSVGSSRLEPADGAALDVSGLSDVTAQALWRLASGRLLLQAGANLPAGKKELTKDEFSVVSALSHPVLAFPLKQYGRGLDLSAGAALAGPLSETVSAGIGAGVVVAGKYKFLAGSEDFTPGLEFAVSGGLDLGGEGSGNGPSPLRLDATWRTFGKDKVGDMEIFQEGSQVELQGLGRASLGSLDLTALARGVLKSDNTILGEPGSDVESITEAAGTSVTGQLGAEIPVSAGLRVGVLGELRRFDGSAGSRADGQAFGVGPTALVALGNAGWLRAGGMILSGTLDGGDAPDTDLSGIAATIAFFWRGSFETR